jgi:hypothetical protein
LLKKRGDAAAIDRGALAYGEAKAAGEMNTGPKLNRFRRVNVRDFNYSVAGNGGVLVALRSIYAEKLKVHLG